MKCKYCEGNLIEFNDNYACDKCGSLYKIIDDELVSMTCNKCGTDLNDGVCPFCENEIVINGEDEEEALFCPDCGFALDINGKCRECGTKVDLTYDS